MEAIREQQREMPFFAAVGLREAHSEHLGRMSDAGAMRYAIHESGLDDYEAAALMGLEQIDNYSRADLESIKVFVKRLGFWPVLDAADSAFGRFGSTKRAFRYFCGTCWAQIRQSDDLTAFVNASGSGL